jgi:hypothetical protein
MGILAGRSHPRVGGDDQAAIDFIGTGSGNEKIVAAATLHTMAGAK